MSNIVVTDHGAHPTAAAYYRMCTYELIGANGRLSLGQVFPIQDLTLTALLDKVTQELSRQNGTLVLACHGNPDALIIPLYSGDKIKASRDALNLLGSGRSASAVAPLLKMSETQLNSLRAKMDAVRAMSLDRVEIRGCRVGDSSMTMEAIRDFFGAAKVGAPKIFNAWGTMRADTNQANYNYSRYDRLRHGYHATVGSGGHLGFEFQRRTRTTFRIRNARATSQAHLRRWAVETFPIRLRTMVSTAQGQVAQYRDLREDQVDPDPYDDVPARNLPIHMQLTDSDEIRMPLTTEYRNNLDEVSRPDPNDPLSGF